MASDPRFHILLIGIDAYPTKPLGGCVNDIDAVQRLLLTQARVPASAVTRLASPHADDRHDTTVPEQPATLANIRAAIDRLASDEVGPADRVFIYYSGHGARAPVAAPGGTTYRESLVPVDFNEEPGRPRLLLDFELNHALDAVVKKTRCITVILDCCHSAGATRQASGAPDARARFLDLEAALPGLAPLTVNGAATRGAAAGVGPGVDDCQVVAACLNHELAVEDARYLGGPLSSSLQFQLTPADIAYCRTQADRPDGRSSPSVSGKHGADASTNQR
jgi:hypothetical protein